MTARGLLAVTLAGGALGGCGISDPAATTKPSAPAPTPTRLRTPAVTQRDPLVRVAVDYTLTQATWSADTYLAQKARLARLSSGGARAQLAITGNPAPADIVAQLRAARSSNTASLIGTDGPTAKHKVVVAYKVLATGIGRSRGRADYAIAHLTMTRHGRSWLVHDFAIQP